MKKYVLLDWDGNLAKTLDIWLKACRMAIENQEVYKSDEEIGSSFGKFADHLEAWGVPNLNKAIDDADTIAKQELPQVELYPDALYVLEELKQRGHKLALVTTSPHENIWHLLEKHHLTEVFDVLVAADDVKNHKPHPEPLETALIRLGGTKDQAIMIGDSDKDIGAANNAGIDSILFYPNEHKKFYDIEKLKELKPTHVVSDFKKIIDIIS
jgi:HAD superfamily hydrolase (TIGR01509 family)